MVNSIFCLIIGLSIGSFISDYISSKVKNKKLKRFNTNYLCADNNTFNISFDVIKAEKTLSKEGKKWLAKYTIKRLYLTSKDNIDVQEYYFYDEIGKYNIGDKLELITIKDK